MIKMMLTVVTVYSVSWLPFNLIVVIGDLYPSIWAWEYMTYVFPIIQWLALAHTICNPFIYAWMNSRFRSGFRSAIENVPLCKRLRFFRRDGSQNQHFCLNHQRRLNTYTFQSGGQGKLIRNASVISNGGRTTTVNLSPSYLSTTFKTFPDASRMGHQVTGVTRSSSQFSSSPHASSIPLQVLESSSQDQNQIEKEHLELAASDTAAVVAATVHGRKNRPRNATRTDSLLESFL